MYERPMRQLFLLLPLAGVALAGLPACGPLPDDEEAEVLDGEIVGGSPARADDARFMAAFFGDKILFDGSRESGHFCGGTFIAPDLVLTASHCVVETPAYLMSVGNRKRRLSDHLVEQRFVAGPDGAAVAAYWLHPGYDGSVLDNDVALVKLARPLRPRVLPFLDGPEQERRLAAPGTSSTVVGWGAIDKRVTRFPDDLRRGTVPILPRTTCGEKAYEFGQAFSGAMLCAGGGKTDTCGGDSGGPLLVRGANGAPTVAGVTSFGLIPDGSCGIQSEPGYYSRMGTLGSWVRGCMQDPRRCTGEGASYCRVDGRCNNESRPMGLLDPASPAHRDRALCFAEAKAAFEACDNAPRGWTVAASFVDAGGTQLARYPACRVEGPCLQAAAGFVRALLLTEDEPTCLAQAEAAHGECGNSSALPLTATFFSPEKVATRTFPGR